MPDHPTQIDNTAPYRIDGLQVEPDWIDHNGHMNVAYYHLAFDRAAGSFFRWLGLDETYRKTHQASTFALESHLNYHRELRLGEGFRIEALLLSGDARRLHFCMQMFKDGSGELAAYYESLSMHVDMRTRRTSPMAGELQERVAMIAQAHARLSRPWQLGRVVGEPLPAAARRQALAS
jgi:acyl-CoA thioester hydrolase